MPETLNFVEDIQTCEHPFVIAEIGINHNGDIDLAKDKSEKLIEVLIALEELDDVQNIFTNANLKNLQ